VAGGTAVKLSPRIHRLAAVLVVVFVLTTVWAVYYLYAETHPSGGGSSGTTVATYSESSVGGFAAAVRPSYLYNNSTEVYGGNVILFTPITNWINASITYSLESNRTAAISLAETFAVTLSTPVWSKTLFTTLNSSSLPAATAATLTLRYAINVSSVVALAAAIDAQLGYQGNAYTLSLDPAISGSVKVGANEQLLALEPRLNFTFTGSLITPTGLAYASTGSLFAPAVPMTAGGLSATVPYLALVGSVGGLGCSAWVATRRSEEERVPPLDEIIRPYEEAIAVVAGTPTEATATPVATFVDLVKIADTLGKPILRPTGPDAARRTFFVLDGLLAYTYRYPYNGGTPAETPAPSENETDSPSARGWSPTTAALVQQLQQEVKRLHDLSLDAATAADARRRVSRALDLIRAGAEAEVAIEIEELSRLLTSASERLGQGR
jgi:hypothetical protein